MFKQFQFHQRYMNQNLNISRPLMFSLSHSITISESVLLRRIVEIYKSSFFLLRFAEAEIHFVLYLILYHIWPMESVRNILNRSLLIFRKTRQEPGEDSSLNSGSRVHSRNIHYNGQHLGFWPTIIEYLA